MRRERLAPPADLLDVPGVSALVQEADRVLPFVRPPQPDFLVSISRERFPGLYHPLSAHYAAMTRMPDKSGRNVEERLLLNLFAQKRPFCRTGDYFLQILQAANALLSGCSGRFREQEAGLTSNDAPIRVLFPAPDGAVGQLRHLHAFVRSRPWSVYTAVVALGLFLNCHPFADGNGRIGRALWNHILLGAGATSYFPLHAFFAPTEGSFDLALREAEMKADWVPFVQYNCLLLTCCSSS